MTEVVKDEPAIVISLQLPLDDGTGRAVGFNSALPQSCDESELNGLLDKLVRAGERQKAQVLLPTYRNQLAEKQEALVSQTNALYLAQTEADTQSELWRKQANESGRRNWKPSVIQDQARAKVENTIAQCKQNIKRLEAEIASEQDRVNLYEQRVGA